MGPYFDQMKYYHKPNLKISSSISHQMTVHLGYANHLLLECLIKNNNDIRSLGHKNGNYF